MPRLRYRVDFDAREADRGARVAERAIERVERQSRATGRAVDRMGRDMDRAGRMASTASRGFRRAHAALASIATGAVAVGLQRVIANAAELGDSLTNLSRATDLSVEALQTYGEAFRQGGASQAQYEAGVARLGLSLAQARRGTELQAAALRELNVTDLTDVEGALRRIFETVDADSFQRLRPVLRQVFGDDAVRVFGSTLQRSIRDVDRIRERVGVLGTEGAAALSGLASAASEVGEAVRVALANAVGESADSFARSVGRLQAVFIELQPAISAVAVDLAAATNHLAALAEVLGDAGREGGIFADGFTAALARAAGAPESVVQKLIETRDAAASVTGEFVAGLNPALKDFRAITVEGLQDVSEAASTATTTIGTLRGAVDRSAVGFGLLAGETQRVRRNLADVAAEIAGGFEIPEVRVFRSVDALGELGEAAAEVDREFLTASRAVESHMRRIVDSIADGTATAGDLLRTLTAALLNVGVDLLGRRVATGSFSATPTAASAGRTLANAQASQRAQPIHVTVRNELSVSALDAPSAREAVERLAPMLNEVTQAGVMNALQRATPLRAAVRGAAR